MASDFSKKMCHELLLFEDYLLSCKAVPFQKDKILIEKKKTIDLIAELRIHHCASRDLQMPDGTTAKADKVFPVPHPTLEDLVAAQPLPKETPTPSTTAPKERAQMLTLANEERDRVLQRAKAEALAESEQLLAEARDQATTESQRILKNAQDQAKFLLVDAKLKADLMINQATEQLQHKEAKFKQQEDEVEALLLAKIAQVEDQSRLVIEKADDYADSLLEDREIRANNLIESALQRALHLIEQVERIYEKQLEVVGSDCQELRKIIASLERW